MGGHNIYNCSSLVRLRLQASMWSLRLISLFCAYASAEPPRYWPRFGGTRQVSTLDGEWSFGFIDGGDGSSPGFDAMNPSFEPSQNLTPNKTSVPGCMDNVAGGAPGYMGPRGTGFYRTLFRGPAQGIGVWLQFQACSFYCRVWVNGKEVGEHLAGGYVAFYLDVSTDMIRASQDNELFVLADNRYNHTTAPMHTGGDFWHYGGLMRSVELHHMATAGESVVWRAYVQPNGGDMYSGHPQVTHPTSVDVHVEMSNQLSGPIRLALTFDDGSPSMVDTHATSGSVRLKNLTVPNPKSWSPQNPQLHTLKVSYNGGSVTERFGLRTFGVDKNARLTVNGEVLKLVGWNHHTQWPVTAASPTDEQIDADVALLKKGNANYVRGAHYPHDPRMLDRLDEAGILFWSETIGPSVSVENTLDWDFFMKYQLQQLQEMLDNALNHASIFTWGWFNEGPTDHKEACPAYEACSNYSRTRDPTRFNTWADDKDLKGLCYEHTSLISFNNYPGWYNRPGDKTAPESYWNQMANTVRGWEKPLIISESGAGGIFEWSNNDTDAKWTLNYQSEIISSDVQVAIVNANISGISLWHFYDFKVDNCGAHWPCKGGGQENNTHCDYNHSPPTTFEELASKGPPNCTSIIVNNRPGGENHKGTLDFWRRPKPVFTVVADKYKNANANQ